MIIVRPQEERIKGSLQVELVPGSPGNSAKASLFV